MAFQIKKDLHLDIGIYLELLDDLTNAQVKTDNYDNTKYIVPIKHIGNDITEGGGLKWFQDKDTQEWVILKDGKSTDIELTQSQYDRLVKYNKGSKVQVMMKEMQGKMGSYTGIEVKPLNGVASSDSAEVATDTPKAVNVPKKVITNGSLGITWGMSINNATQLMIAKGLDEKADIIDELEYTASKIMDVAVNGLVRWEQEQHEKDQNSAPNDGDLPF